jgi:hypothetical protein
MTPMAAVAENFDQLEAMPSHSRLSRKKRSFSKKSCVPPSTKSNWYAKSFSCGTSKVNSGTVRDALLRVTSNRVRART